MTTIFAIISNLRLSLTQIAYGLVALAVGGLVIALRLQGSKLHATQIALLQATYGTKLDKYNAKVEAATVKYNKAKAAYEANK